MMKPEIGRVVIVGGGLAAVRSAAELSRIGFKGEVRVVSAECHLPYNRPPLSKGLVDIGSASELSVPGLPSTATMMLGTTALGLGAGVVHTSAGDLAADAVVVATGSAPIRVPGPGPQHVLRTWDDAEIIHRALRKGSSLVVVGASWLGAEIAGTARAAGCSVTCIEFDAAPLARVLGRELGERTIPWWDGIDLRVGEAVRSVGPNGVLLGDGSSIEADMVLSAVGCTPSVDWLEGSGVTLSRGVVTDEHMLAMMPTANDWSGRLAVVGDASTWFSRRYQRQMRVAHWDHAMLSPKAAITNLLTEDLQVYDPVPYFWSEQLGHRIQYMGSHDPDTDRLEVRDHPDGGWSAYWIRPSGALGAYLAVDIQANLGAVRGVIASQDQVDVDALSEGRASSAAV